MANEFSLNVALTCNNAPYRNVIQPQAISFNQTLLGAIGGVISVATAGTAISTSALTTEGYVFLQNCDATNYVDFGINVSGTITPFVRLKPSEYAVFRLTPSTSVMAQAHTAAVDLSYTIFND